MKSSSSSSSGASSTSGASGTSGANGDRTLVRSSDIPASLRQSLQGSDYTGWENGHVYKTKNGEYIVEIQKNGMTKTHRFDANGQPKKDQ
jgi:hypothetical protein